ncbi:MAG: hypothetical protein FJ290_32275 [Planctomycetes bacterium]|nr:hypothetical protein [Planctomycetota bacterium]
MRPIGLVVACCVGFACWTAPAAASWAYVPPEILMADADAVVVGKMTQVDKAAGTGVVAVSEVLKGPKELKEAKVKFSPMPAGGLVHSAMISFNDGQEGIWILKSKDASGAYPLNYPLLRQDKSKLDAVKAQLAALESRKWSEPVNSLAASCLVSLTPGGDTATGFVSVKNVGDRPVRVNTYVGARTLAVTVVAPDGTGAQLDLYSWLERARLRAPQASDYPELAPGAARNVGPQHFSIPLGKKGEYRVKVTLSNADDAKTLGLKGVWTGKITVPEVTFTP